MKKTITIHRYDGLHRRTADELLSIDFTANGAFAEPPPTSSRELRRGRCLEDASPILSDDSSNTGNISNSPMVQSFLNNGWLGEAIIASVQLISTISDAIVNCVKTWVIFRCPNPKEAQLAAKIVGNPDLAKIIQRLPPRHFVVWSEDFEGPVIGVTPTINIGASPTEAEIAQHMAPYFDEISRNIVLSPAFEDHSGAPICYLDDEIIEHSAEETDAGVPDDPDILADYVKFITVIASNQNLSTRELNSLLGMSASKAGKIKAALVSHGYVTIHKESGTTGRPRLIVNITSKGLQLLESWRASQ